MKGWDLDSFRQSEAAKRPENSHLLEVKKPKAKRAKYNNEKVEYDGMVFDSKGELKRHRELMILLKHAIIARLERQVSFELNPGGTHSVKYKADWTYYIQETGEFIVEDFKGMETAVFKKKEKLMKKIHGITILKTKK